jgi:nucleotidyltransferase/DNA polymerase involved in DNA repair
VGLNELSPVSVIPGIGPKYAAELASKNIETVQELWNGIQVDESLIKFRQLVEKFMNDLNFAPAPDFHNIRQLVLDVDFEFS